MFEAMRKVFGPAAVSVIIGAIALVFVFYGIYSPGAGTSGLGAGAVAATVNGDPISIREFQQEYEQRVESYSAMFKGKADPKILKQLRLRQVVLDDLVNRKLLLQESKRQGILVSDAEVRDAIQEMPYFKQKAEGRFDPVLYHRILEANNRTPGDFENAVREDLSRGRLVEFVRGLSKVSDREVEQEFMVTEDRRQLDFVLLNRETAKKRMVVADKEIDEFLKVEANANSAKVYYDQHKYQYMKPMPKPAPKAKLDPKAPPPAGPEFFAYDEVKRKVVTDLLKDRKSEEAQKINKEVSAQVLAKAKSMARPAFKSYVKTLGLEVKTSEKFNRAQGGIPGVGEVPQLMEDAFKEPSPLSKEPKSYEHRTDFVIAFDVKAFKPKMEELPKQREIFSRSLVERKEQQIYQQWIQDLRSKAKISMNKEVVSEDES